MPGLGKTWENCVRNSERAAMSSSDMFDIFNIFIQYANVCSMHRKSLEMKDSTSLSMHLLTRSVSPCLTMSHHVSPRSTYRHSLTHPDFTSSNLHGLHALITGYHRADPGLCWLLAEAVWSSWSLWSWSWDNGELLLHRITATCPVSLCLLQVCCSFADLWKSAPSAPTIPCHPLPSPAYVLSTFLYDLLPTARWDASDRQEQKSHETWHQDQVLESGESQVCSSQTASKCFKISVESRFNTGNIWQSLWIVTRESLKSNFRIWAQRISEHILYYIYSTQLVAS